MVKGMVGKGNEYCIVPESTCTYVSIWRFTLTNGLDVAGEENMKYLFCSITLLRNLD